MDLIYTDTRRSDVGVLQDYSLDLAFGSDENDFSLTLDSTQHCCDANCLVYIENTDYGGIIDGLGVVTKDGKLVYGGRTWYGILANKVIEPNEGESHLTVSGEANKILYDLIKRLGLSDLFVVSADDSGLVIDSYSFNRYIDAYSGIKKMLEYVSGKIKIRFVNGLVVMSAVPIVDYSKDEQFDNDMVEMEIEKMTNTVNHLICLGKGEMEDRKVIHLYVDRDGNVTNTQYFFGTQEMALVYEYSNAEDEKLLEDAKKKLLEQASTDKVQMNFTADEDIYDIGDIISAREIITGIVATAKITKKIVTINRGEVTIQYKVGE